MYAPLDRFKLLGGSLLALLLALTAGCASDSADAPIVNDEDALGSGADFVRNPSSFVSAEGAAGDQAANRGDGSLDAGTGAPTDDAGGGTTRTVEEGDIYRVLADQKILNLNSYRGLQVIDIANLEEPTVISRLPITGTPVEMYVVGDRAFVLMNNWRGYYGNRSDIRVETQEGGLVLSVDLSDPLHPVELGRAFVPGFIQTSRLTRDGDVAALYVAANEYGNFEQADGTVQWENRTVLKSFDVSGSSIVPKSELNLGGYVAALQATTEALLVSRFSWTGSSPNSTVSVVDISDPAGNMIAGDEVEVSGQVWNKYNMDLYEGVLRVVSGRTWGGGTNANHVQTWNATDLGSLLPIDEATFGDGQQLFASLFLGNKAFFVTYLRTDPFHAFEVAPDGTITERAEYIVSGWNNYFRPVFNDSRLIGIGMNDVGGTTMAVSLYDIEDLTNPEPLISRDEVSANNSWSEAVWDDRAFSVLEDVVSVEGSGGVTETGLVLLPYSGWDSAYTTYQSAVQIFTFSNNTLTRRGVMNEGNPVRRSFLAAPDTTANLGEEELSTYDTADPNNPAELGRVELAPNATGSLVFGDYGVRLIDNGAASWWYASRGVRPDARVEIVPLSAGIDLGAAVATLDVPSGAQLERVGNLLVVVSAAYENLPEYPYYSTTTTLKAFDLADPTAPLALGTLETDAIPADSYGGYWGGPGMVDCMDCGRGWYGTSLLSRTHATSKALTFIRSTQEQESLGMVHTCSSYPTATSSAGCSTDDLASCEWISGGRTCNTNEAGETVCTGAYYHCGYDAAGSYSCTEIDAADVAVSTSCYDNEQFRYWNRYRAFVVNFEQPSDPVLEPVVEMSSGEQGVATVAEGDTLYYSYKVPYDVEGDPRPYARYFFRTLDLSQPSAPILSAGVNVPGQVLDVSGDYLFTQDTVYGDAIIETSLARVRMFEGSAYLMNRLRLPDQQVEAVQLDGRGNLLVSHRDSWWSTVTAGGTGSDMQKLSIFDVSLHELASVNVDAWATLSGAQDGRALFQVPGGLMVVNLDAPANPFPQAYFPTAGWPQKIDIAGDRAYFAAGRYGIYDFDLNTYNLLPLL